jgi:hypothetical protein
MKTATRIRAITKRRIKTNPIMERVMKMATAPSHNS